MTPEPDYYHTIEQEGYAEFKDRGSRFIGYAFPLENIESFKEKLQQVKKLHPKASHHCFAYRLGLDQNQYRVSDDGEPSGSAGRPILGQIDSRSLTHVLVVVVRYFGGTLLGVPGLIQAYKSAAALALQVTPVVRRQVEVPHRIQFDYTQLNEVMMVLKQTQSRVLVQELQLFCHIDAGIPRVRLEETLHRLRELRDVTVSRI